MGDAPLTAETLADIQESWDCGYLKDLLRGHSLGEVLPDMLRELRSHRTAQRGDMVRVPKPFVITDADWEEGWRRIELTAKADDKFSMGQIATKASEIAMLKAAAPTPPALSDTDKLSNGK